MAQTHDFEKEDTLDSVVRLLRSAVSFNQSRVLLHHATAGMEGRNEQNDDVADNTVAAKRQRHPQVKRGMVPRRLPSRVAAIRRHAREGSVCGSPRVRGGFRDFAECHV
ncbi:hypothetical protein BHE74_00017617 [Ensete ventricosum]|nr:hypothetical protein GW17_00047422 [Ensete ventricosum]RWW74440.1 hypothetical protein BHE74_00017617 [Ensete ventricosum]RZS01403.1 hypothetical protein BHM03_00031244 [Ensete ventricosum]